MDNNPHAPPETPTQASAASCVNSAAPLSRALARESDRVADRLVAGAAPSRLAAGAMDREAGPPLFTDLLGHELASSHHVLMRFAAAASSFMGAEFGAKRGRARRTIAAQLAGARAAASAGRVLDHTRLALIAWGRRRPVAAEGERWVPYRLVNTVFTPEQIARQRAAAQAHHEAQQAAGGKKKPAIGPRARDLLEKAAAPAAKLMAAGDAKVLAARVAAAGGSNFMRGLFTDELVAIHALKMRLDGGAVHALDRALAKGTAPLAACRLAEGAARAGDRFRRGLASLAMFDATPTGTGGKVHYFYLDTDFEKTDGGTGGETPAPAAVPSLQHLYATPSQRRGRLANGNPSGDFLAAPRCGAHTRHGGACRQPAMARPRGGGGRCRLHGGKSTGPRTAEGLASSRAARLVHGGYSAEIIDLRKEAAFRVRRLRALTAACESRPRAAGEGGECQRAGGGIPAGHGVHPRQPAPSGAALAFSGPSGYEPARLRNPHAGLAAGRGEIPAVAPVFPASARG